MSWFEDEIPQYVPDYVIDEKDLTLTGWNLDSEESEGKMVSMKEVSGKKLIIEASSKEIDYREE